MCIWHVTATGVSIELQLKRQVICNSNKEMKNDGFIYREEFHGRQTQSRLFCGCAASVSNRLELTEFSIITIQRQSHRRSKRCVCVAERGKNGKWNLLQCQSDEHMTIIFITILLRHHFRFIFPFYITCFRLVHLESKSKQKVSLHCARNSRNEINLASIISWDTKRDCKCKLSSQKEKFDKCLMCSLSQLIWAECVWMRVCWNHFKN